ncbi:MAG TPA: hypothetical protein VE963_10880 [Reyranella sp.]|nr:hypothetical protein [Reyranella sp.]
MGAQLPGLLVTIAQQAADAGWPDARLRPPQKIHLGTVQQFSLVQKWPTLTIDTRAIAPQQGDLSDQLGGTAFQGLVEMRYFEQDSNSERLASALDRYASALQLALIYGDENGLLAGATLDYTSWSIAPTEPFGTTANMRAVQLLVGVFL